MAELHNVLLGAHHELLARDGDDQVGQRGDDGAVHGGLAARGGQVVAHRLEHLRGGDEIGSNETRGVQYLEDGLVGGVVGEQVLGVGEHGGAQRAVGAARAEANRAAHLRGVHALDEQVDDLLAVLFDQHVALAREHAHGADLRVELLDNVARARDQTGARVRDRRALGADRTRALQTKRVELEAPVGLGGEGRVDKVARVVRGIDAAEHHLATGRVVAALAVEPEREHGLAHQALREQVVPHGGDVVDRDGVEGEAQHAVELAEQEGETRFAVDLRAR